jgi:hypothetical protein
MYHEGRDWKEPRRELGSELGRELGRELGGSSKGMEMEE